jgi:hypothetical protein
MGALLAISLALLPGLAARASSEVLWYRIPPGAAVKNPPFPEGNKAFIALAYDRLLGRSPGVGETAKWEKSLRKGPKERDRMVTSLMAGDEYYVRILFLDLLRRAPAREEMRVRLDFLSGGGSRREVVRNLLNSPQYRATLR